ncbi:MAG: DEAD/DEAH box helicase [Campylobacteraceae bacterium]|nr:DEAD/DEAH box helicase [Campylobacteraceae bacterium]
MLFTQLGLSQPILKAIEDQGYTEPTPVQANAIPVILEGRDVLAGAQTGTGKTAGFTLPLLELLSNKAPKGKTFVRALILTPTRELAAQVGESIATYGKYLDFKSTVIFGGVGINPQKAALKKGMAIVTATPGRLLDLVSQKSIDLSHVEFLILDEADRMLDMGFIHDIKRILAIMPKSRQTLFFSATFSDEIKRLADGMLTNPALIEVARRNTSSEQVAQIIHYVDKSKKKELLTHLISEEKWKQVLVFTRTKHGANKLSEHLNKNFITSSAIHGNKSQGARTKALADFKSGKVRVLVATDIAARGIDIDLLPHVVNFELPNVSEDYVHRIGRTGRAGNFGQAVSLVCGEEMEDLEGIEKLIKKSIEVVEVDDFTSIQKKVKAVKPQRGQRNQTPKSRPRDSSDKSRSNADRQRKQRPDDSRNDSRGNSRSDSRNDSRGNSRSDSRNDSRGNSRSDSRNDSRNDSRGNSRSDSRGDSRGDSKTSSRSGSYSTKSKFNSKSNDSRNDRSDSKSTRPESKKNVFPNRKPAKY